MLPKRISPSSNSNLKRVFHFLFKSFSVGYTSKDLVYRWNRARQVAIADDMKLSQFDLIASLAANHTDTIINSDTKTGVLRHSNIFICKENVE